MMMILAETLMAFNFLTSLGTAGHLEKQRTCFLVFGIEVERGLELQMVMGSPLCIRYLARVTGDSG